MAQPETKLDIPALEKEIVDKRNRILEIEQTVKDYHAGQIGVKCDDLIHSLQLCGGMIDTKELTQKLRQIITLIKGDNWKLARGIKSKEVTYVDVDNALILKWLRRNAKGKTNAKAKSDIGSGCGLKEREVFKFLAWKQFVNDNNVKRVGKAKDMKYYVA